MAAAAAAEVPLTSLSDDEVADLVHRREVPAHTLEQVRPPKSSRLYAPLLFQTNSVA